MRWPDGTVYEGNFVAGNREGEGTINMPPAEGEERGFSYTGQWKAGEIDGKGVATYANGDVYEGMFVRGKRQGEGTIRYASGEERTGSWDNGVLTEDSGN